MNDRYRELQFLQVLRVDGNLYHLFSSGWTNSDIIMTFERYEKDGLINVTQEGVELTKKGKLYFNKLCKFLGKRGISRYLSLSLEFQITPLSKDSIYIPNMNKPVRSFSNCENRGSMSHRSSK